MKINIKIPDIVSKEDIKRFLILLVFMFVLSVIIVSAVHSEWISVQQISKNDAGTIPLDSNANGIIDNYGEYDPVPYSIMSNFSSNSQNILGKQLYWDNEGGFVILCINNTQYPGYCTWFG
jgi:hypothetical protein